MAVIKCKMCGGDLEISEKLTVAECEYCGTMQTIPTADNEKKLTLFARANRLLRACEFDKAGGVFESIVAEFPEEAEAYWGLVLCKYGIEYVDDPATAKKIPTCHRSSFDGVMDDANFELVMEYADVTARKVYRAEAKTIEELRKGIIEVSGREDPYDIFICYKETDENGDRTIDSVIAQDVYNELSDKGYRVFFARISLEDKLGQEYEPYIFAALHSAKIMLAFGTDYEYYNAVWVKNEWSRFLQMIATGEKKTLIPCFKGIDAYDMPKEFARLQAQDMGKVGAIQDLLRGIEKILGKQPEIVLSQPVMIAQSTTGPNVDSLLRRAKMFLEDKDWKNADEYYDRILDINPECSEAYLGKSLARQEYPDLKTMVQAYIAGKDSIKEEVLEALPADESREESIVTTNILAGYLAEGELRPMLAFNRNYTSKLAGLKAYQREAFDLFEGDRNLSRALQFDTTDGIAAVIKPAHEEIFVTLQGCIEDAMRCDEEAVQKIEAAYKQHLDNVEKTAKTMHEAAEKERINDYHRIMHDLTEVQRYEKAKETMEILQRIALHNDRLAQECKTEIKRVAKGPMLHILNTQRASLRTDLAALEKMRFKSSREKAEIELTRERIRELDAEIRHLMS